MTKEEIQKEISSSNDKLVKLHKDLSVIEQKEYKELLKNRARVLRSYIGKKVVIRTWNEYIICIILKVTRRRDEYAPFKIYVGNYVSLNRQQTDFTLGVTRLEYSNDSRCGWLDISEKEDDVVLYDESPVKDKFDEILNFMKNF